MTNSQPQDLRERCFYLLTLFKAKDMALFEKYTAQLAKTSVEDSAEFYRYLMGEYKKLLEGPAMPAVQAPAVKTAAPKKAVAKKTVTKKKTAKKVAKKTAKKTVKKTSKKASKKVAVKTKKKPAKKKSKR